MSPNRGLGIKRDNESMTVEEVIQGEQTCKEIIDQPTYLKIPSDEPLEGRVLRGGGLRK